MFSTFLMITVGLFVILGIPLILSILFRTVVETNNVHIVQSSKNTTSYGKDHAAGNTYYAWPSWLPFIGVKTIILPVSVFSRNLDSYAAYDKDRVPFVIDIEAFFRIVDSDVAAQRVEEVDQLVDQLDAILKGAARSILARSEINEILEGRGQFGDEFTKEVDEQLEQWGVQTVKTIELMDIRDAEGSKVIHNIMAKKKSFIEKESRIEVAENMRAAQEKEIEAKRQVDISQQEADQKVGERTAEKDRLVGIANEQAKQAIKEQAKITAERDMEVRRVEEVKQAEIQKDVEIVQADQAKQTDIIRADGQKQQTILLADGKLEEERKQATGIEVKGQANAEAKRLMELAPISAQIELAREIGENKSYQEYLIKIRALEAQETVGIEQAGALQKADVKVIANTGDPVAGVDKVMDLFTSKGGTNLGAMLEGLAQTEIGKDILTKVTGSKPESQNLD